MWAFFAEFSYFKCYIWTSWQCVKKQVLQKRILGEHFNNFLTCWNLQGKLLKGYFDLDMNICFPLPPPREQLDENVYMSVLVYPDLGWLWYDPICPEIGVADYISQKEYPKINNWPNVIHKTKPLPPKLKLTSDRSNKNTKNKNFSVSFG